MTTTTANARDEMMAIIAAILPALPGVVVKWQGVDTLDPPSQDTDWMRVDIGHEAGGQASLSGPVNGATRWGQDGLITVQCFGRMSAGGITKAMEMACAVRDAFRGRATAGGVWFKRQTIREVGQDKGWYQVNATIIFDYDEVIQHVP